MLTQSFDFGLGVLTAVTAPTVFLAIRKARREIASWPNVKQSRHKLGGSQFNWRGEELGHIHSNGVADLRFNASEKTEAISNHLAEPHHVNPKSTWVSYFIVRGDQVGAVVALFRIPFQRLTTSRDFEPPSEEYAQ
jgi:hypothetical protein